MGKRVGQTGPLVSSQRPPSDAGGERGGRRNGSCCRKGFWDLDNFCFWFFEGTDSREGKLERLSLMAGGEGCAGGSDRAGGSGTANHGLHPGARREAGGGGALKGCVGGVGKQRRGDINEKCGVVCFLSGKISHSASCRLQCRDVTPQPQKCGLVPYRRTRPRPPPAPSSRPTALHAAAAAHSFILRDTHIHCGDAARTTPHPVPVDAP